MVEMAFRPCRPVEISGQWMVPDDQELVTREIPKEFFCGEKYFPRFDLLLPTVTLYFERMPRGESWARLTHPIEAPWPAFEEGDRGRLEAGQQTIEFIVTGLDERHDGSATVEARVTRITYRPAGPAR